MAFNVPNETKIQMLTRRIESLNLEGYQHELNKKAAEALGNVDAVEQAEAAIATIQSAIAVQEEELQALSE